jgi:gamma-glutamyltranspeptidase / glutathione hydrolase
LFTTRPQLEGTFGMVASTHWLASASGMAVLEKGGNAFDAAVAAGLVLQVVEPHLNGPGGEVPIILYDAKLATARVINGQGPAPAAATLEHFADLGLELIPGDGLLPACVPGAFDAWMLLLRDHGRLRLAEVMDYALGYASRGFPLGPHACAAIAGAAGMFRREWTSSAEVYLPGGRAPRPGALHSNRALSATYERVLAHAEAASSDRDGQIDAARDAWYRGFVADAVAAFTHSEVGDSTGGRHPGLIRDGDLAAYEAAIEDPIAFDYLGHTVCKTGPWGQGPVFLQQLGLLAGFELPALDPAGAEFVHLVVECAKLAFADREAYYGDPAFVDVPLATLLDPAYADRRRPLIGERASGELVPGRVAERLPVIPVPAPASGPSGPGDPTLGLATAGPGDTCHVDVADRFGNLVAATPSGGWLQSSPVIPALGWPLGTRAQMFWLVAAHPNSLAPGKRPRTTLSPSLALRDGEAWLAFGTPGGDQQDQWTLVFFLRHVHHGLNLQAAIDAPSWHTEHFPSSFYPRDSHPRRVLVEARLGDDVVAELRRRGHDVVVADPWSLGRVSVAGRSPRGTLVAAANPRGMQGYAVGR